MTTPQPPEHMRPSHAERQLLGAVLRDPGDALDAALRHLDGPGDFYTVAHRIIFEVAADVYTRTRAGGPADVFGELVRRGLTAELGPTPAALLGELYTDVATAANADYHAKLVRDAALRRRFLHAARELVRDAEAPPATGTAAEVIGQAASKLQDLLDAAAGRSQSVARLQDVLNEAMAEVDARHADPGRRLGVSSGFDMLDALLGGFRPGQLIVIGARPGVGKTAATLAILSAVARSAGPAFLASLEMPRLEIGERLLAMGASVKLGRIRSGRVNVDDVERLAAAVGPGGYGGCELFVDDTPDVTAARFGATVRTLVRRSGVKLAAVDYLQILRPADPHANRVQQVGRDARELKLVARQCGIPVLAPCQLNRGVEDRAGGVPRLSDLRESGEIEQHSDIVVMLHVPPGQDDDSPVLQVEAHVVKSRNGPLGRVTLGYRRSTVRFENAA